MIKYIKLLFTSKQKLKNQLKAAQDYNEWLRDCLKEQKRHSASKSDRIANQRKNIKIIERKLRKANKRITKLTNEKENLKQRLYPNKRKNIIDLVV